MEMEKKLMHSIRIKRYNTILKLTNISETDKILDIGCGKKDKSFSFFNNKNEIVGLDIHDSTENDGGNFRYIKGDAEKLPFKEKGFDVGVSIGMIEHIHPEEKMINCLKEIERVCKKYAIIVPHRYGFIEPHFQLPFWYFYPEFIKKGLIKRFNLGSQKRRIDGNYQKLNHPPAKFYKKILKGCKVKNLFFGPLLLYYLTKLLHFF